MCIPPFSKHSHAPLVSSRPKGKVRPSVDVLCSSFSTVLCLQCGVEVLCIPQTIEEEFVAECRRVIAWLITLCCRCIRHRNDFGAIVLCDPRYSSQPEATASLSRWVRSSVQQCRTVEASLQSVDRFFRHHLAEASDRAANAAVGRQSPVAGEAVGADSAPQGCSSRGGVCGGAVSNCRREDGRGSLRKDDLRDVPKLYPAERVMQPTVSQVRCIDVRGM